MADLKLTVDYSELVAAAKTTDQTKQTLRLLGQQFARTGDQSAYMRAVNQVANAQKKLAVESRMSRGEIMKLASQYRQTTVYADALAQAAQRSTRGLARSGVVMQQTGYQVGDFLVQVQSGTNAFVAFGQQATQLAGLLTMSMNPKLIALGATLSIVIPLFTAVAAGIMRTREASNSATGGFTTMEAAMQAAREESTRMADEIERLNRGLKDNTQLNISRAIEQQRLRVTEAEALVEQVAGTDGDAVARQRLAREQETLRQYEAQLQKLKDQAQEIDNINSSREQEAERAAQEERTLLFLEEQSDSLQNQIRLYREITRFGENSIEVENERARQARNAYEDQLRQNKVAEPLVTIYMRYYDTMVEARRESEKATEEEEERLRILKEQLEVQHSQREFVANQVSDLENQIRLAEAILSFGEDSAGVEAERAHQAREAFLLEVMRNGIYGEQLANLTALYDEYARINEILSRPVQGPNLPTTPPRTPRATGGGASGPNAVERLQQEIAFRQRTLNLSKEEKALQTEIFRITNALGEDRNKYSSDFIANLAQQNLALQEQERVIEEARQRHEQMADVIENGIGDALMSMVDGTKSVKDAFKDMARQVIAELYRIIVVQQIANSLAGAIMGGFSGGPTRPVMNPRRASGGSMMSNRPYLVGEHGPELVIPGRSATVTNADLTRKSMGGSDAVNVVNNINVTGGTDPAAIRQEVAKLMPTITNATKSAVIDARRRGGQMKAAFQ